MSSISGSTLIRCHAIIKADSHWERTKKNPICQCTRCAHKFDLNISVENLPGQVVKSFSYAFLYRVGMELASVILGILNYLSVDCGIDRDIYWIKLLARTLYLIFAMLVFDKLICVEQSVINNVTKSCTSSNARNKKNVRNFFSIPLCFSSFPIFEHISSEFVSEMWFWYKLKTVQTNSAKNINKGTLTAINDSKYGRIELKGSVFDSFQPTICHCILFLWYWWRKANENFNYWVVTFCFNSTKRTICEMLPPY